MDRYWKSNAAANAPLPPVVNDGGYPADGTPQNGITGTVPGAWWFHSMTEEVRNAIVSLGGEPDWMKTDQLGAAMTAALGDISSALASQAGAALVGFTQAGANAAARTAQDKMRERVSVDDYYRPDLGDTDYTQAFQRAMTYLAGRSGGIVQCPGPLYVAQSIVIRRFTVVEGLSPAGTVLQQAGGANRDFITSENFAQLSGSGLDVAADARVPSWFGLRKVRIDGNRAQNSTGRPVALYGAALILDDIVVVNGATGGLYTEYAADITGHTGWQTQEEGYVRNVICRDCGGIGWVNRGPHNVYIDNFIACFNDDYGYYSELLAGKYNGAPTYVTSLHCYSNDMQWTNGSNRARRNMYIGVNMSCGLLVIDGAQCEIRGSNSLVAIVKQYFGGQGGDSLILSGSGIALGSHYGIMRNDGTSAGFAVLRIAGNYNQIGTSNVSGTQNLFDGVVITGVGNSIGDLIAQNCRTALSVSGSRNHVRGRMIGNQTAFAYQTPTDFYAGYNDIDLCIYQTSGQYVSGDPPVQDKDTFQIVANGLASGALATRRVLEIGPVAVDTTDIQTIAVPHGLLYTPRRRDVQLSQTGLTGGSVVQLAWGPRCSTTDGTNITVQCKCAVAGPAGSQLNIAASVRIS